MPVAELFPDLSVHEAWQRIRIEAVLSHSAGILDQTSLPLSWLSAAYRDRRPIRKQRSEFAQRILTAPPAGPVGTYSYSNAGYMLAGAALERLAQTSWEDAVSTKLFQPLGMTSAGFFAPVGQQPWGHARAGPSLRPVPPAGLSDNPAVMGPSGQIHTSLSDYAKFLRLFLNGGAGLLRPESIQHLSTPQPMQGGTYALGWEITHGDWGNGTVLAHQGSNTLWHAVSYLAPGRGIGFAGVSNAAPRGSNQAARQVALRLIQRFAPVAPDSRA
jgi:CubicO group peptidase (beta-lactamase class C family)